MLIPENPYIAGNPVGGNIAFIGRTDFLQEVNRVIASPKQNSLLLYGQRRIGKTSILQQLTEQLSAEENYHPVYFDLQDKATWQLEKVLRALADEISYRLKLPKPNDLDFEHDNTFRNQFLPRILEKIGAKSSLILLFDEFDVLDNPSQNQAGKAFFPYLRELMSVYQEQLNFIFVIGRKPEDLDVLTLSVFKGVKAKRVSLLNLTETKKLIYLSKVNNTLNWEEEAVEEIWKLTHGHPYLTQLLCQTIFNCAYSENKNIDATPNISLSNVRAAIPETIESSVNALEWLWNGLPPAERVVFSVLAKAGNRTVSQTEVEKMLLDSGMRIVIDKLQKAPQILKEWDLIESTNESYTFRVELLRQWVNEKKPIERVKQELDYVEPIAQQLYQMGKIFHEQGEIEDAVNDLQRALQKNPNHLNAGLLLSQIYYEKKDLSKATQLLETIYLLNPDAARYHLLKVLQESIKEATNDEAKIIIYERILNLIPNQIDAVEQRKLTLTKLGKRAYQQNNFHEALVFFEKAEDSDKVAEVKKLIQNQEVESFYINFKTYEQEKKYEEALETINQLINNFSTDNTSTWLQDKERIEKIKQIDEMYNKAIQCKNFNDREGAIRLLAYIVYLEPKYESAASILVEMIRPYSFQTFASGCFLGLFPLIALIFFSCMASTPY